MADFLFNQYDDVEIPLKFFKVPGGLTLAKMNQSH
jgi:hypothetical protein